MDQISQLTQQRNSLMEAIFIQEVEQDQLREQARESARAFEARVSDSQAAIRTLVNSCKAVTAELNRVYKAGQDAIAESPPAAQSEPVPAVAPESTPLVAPELAPDPEVQS